MCFFLATPAEPSVASIGGMFVCVLVLENIAQKYLLISQPPDLRIVIRFHSARPPARAESIRIKKGRRQKERKQEEEKKTRWTSNPRWTIPCVAY